MRKKKVIKWSTLSLKDLAEIKFYIASDKPSAASKKAKLIRQAVEKLSLFPFSEKQSVEIPTAREIVVASYRIFYRYHSEQIEILRIYHARRNVVICYSNEENS